MNIEGQIKSLDDWNKEAANIEELVEVNESEMTKKQQERFAAGIQPVVDKYDSNSKLANKRRKLRNKMSKKSRKKNRK